MENQINLVYDNFETIFNKIIEFFQKLTLFRDSPLQDSYLFSFFQIFLKLTQSDIISLTNYSAGKISMMLSKLVKQGELRKEIIPKTHTYNYFLLDYSMKIEFSSDRAKKIGKMMIKNLAYIKKEIPKLIDKYGNNIKSVKLNSKDNKTNLPFEFQEVWSRIHDLENYYKKRQQFLFREESDSSPNFLKSLEKDHFQKIKFPNRLKNRNVSLFSTKCIELSEYPTEIKKFDIEIYNLLLPIDFLPSTDTQIRQILIFFIIREYHTQKTLQDLSNLSSSTISRILQKMVNQHYLKICPFKISRKKVYKMESFELPQRSYQASFNNIIKLLHNQFKDIAQIIQNPENMFIYKQGFPYLFTIIFRILNELQEKL